MYFVGSIVERWYELPGRAPPSTSPYGSRVLQFEQASRSSQYESSHASKSPLCHIWPQSALPFTPR